MVGDDDLMLLRGAEHDMTWLDVCCSGEATPAARTAALLSEWQAMTPGVWDAPCQFGAFVPTRVPEAPIAAGEGLQGHANDPVVSISPLR